MLRVVIATGRSGGHIFPAIAIAENLLKIRPHLDIHFIHSGTEMEKKFFSQRFYKTHCLSVGALASGQGGMKRILTLLSLPWVILKAYFLLLYIRPEAVLGMGGAITGPVLLAAYLQKRKRAIWEGNAVCGLANRLLIPFVTKVFTVFENVPKVPKEKEKRCGYPLRQNILLLKQEEEAQGLNILILGGSQGSQLLNQVVSQAVLEEEWRKDIFIFHQTGVADFDKINEEYKNLKGVQAFSFTSQIENYYQKCQVVVSRAGSGTVAEASFLAKALVLIPLSRTAGNHQLKNALNLYEKSFVEFISEKEFTVKTFKDMVSELKNKDKRKALSQNIRKHHQDGGAFSIAQWMLNDEKKFLKLKR